MKLCNVSLNNTMMLVFICLYAMMSAGCSTILNGQTQTVSVSTFDVTHASCSLENNKGKWYVPSTPGSIQVHRSFSDMHVTCDKKGFRRAEKNVGSTTKGAVFGNVLLGGAIGAGVDMANGSAYDYPAEIQIEMQRVKNS